VLIYANNFNNIFFCLEKTKRWKKFLNPHIFGLLALVVWLRLIASWLQGVGHPPQYAGQFEWLNLKEN